MEEPHLRHVMCREEAAGIIAAQYSKKESGALAAYEEQLNEVTKMTIIS